MTTDAKEIFRRALALPEPERADLIDALSDSLRQSDSALTPEWTAEISRRIAAIESGEAQVIPGDEVEARIRRVLASE